MKLLATVLEDGSLHCDSAAMKKLRAYAGQTVELEPQNLLYNEVLNIARVQHLEEQTVVEGLRQEGAWSKS